MARAATPEAVTVSSVVITADGFICRESLVIKNSKLVIKTAGVEEAVKGDLSQSHPTWISFVVQCLGICLLMQGTWVQSLVQQDSACHGAAEPAYHNYWAGALEPVYCAY